MEHVDKTDKYLLTLISNLKKKNRFALIAFDFY
jgi:hypothetical protein